MTPRADSKAQSSLHAFFKRKTPPPTGSGSAADAVDLTGSPPPKKARSDGGPVGLSQVSSSYFSKKPGGPSRASLSAARLPEPKVALETYRRDGESSGSSTRTDEQKERRAKWQAVLETGSVIRRRRSLALDEAAAREVRRAAGIEDDEPETLLEEGDAEADAATSKRRESADVAVADEVKDKLAKYAAAGAAAPVSKRRKKEVEVGPSGQTYTPLEKQFMEVKAKWMDVILFMEVGYKYKFPQRNFYTASIPTHRLHIHVKKLISLGYKVGVVSQMETAALKKVGDNRNTPFVRELTHLYTAATYVDEPSSSSSTMADEPLRPGSSLPPTGALLAILETTKTNDERVRIAIVSVVPGTGEVVWDEFDDSRVRSELETRLSHLQPTELILPPSLSRPSEKAVKHYTGSLRRVVSSDRSADYELMCSEIVRVERVADVPKFSKAFDHLTEFWKRKGADGAADHVDLTHDSDNDVDMDAPPGSQNTANDPIDPIDIAAGVPAEEAILALVDFPRQVVVALAMLVKYMTDFGLQNAFRHRSSFTQFVNRAHMLLSSNTLDNLEIYRNQTDGGIYGSLLWLLDHTKTRMGRRLMREWIGRPLLDVVALRARIDAIEEIKDGATYHVEKLKSLLVNMPDLVRGLTRIQYGKATPTEVATILVALVRVANEFKPDTTAAAPFRSALLNNILKTLPTIKDVSEAFLGDVKLSKARENSEADMWNDVGKYPDIQDAKDCISMAEHELDEHLKELRKTLKKPALNYVTVSGIEYLIEVPVREVKTVPPKWAKISATKSVSRFHTPEIIRITKEREQSKEMLASAAHRAFLGFQSDIAERHELVVVSRQLAVIDCLSSLAQAAAAQGYCKPEFVAEPVLEIENGRHAMVEMLRDEAYVPFNIAFSEQDGCAKVITGPNMAGKSSCVRATALIVCMAQIGSFVPAARVTLGIHDAVQTRMGASDDIGRGKSTFMVELDETGDIIRTVTPRSLVILDELGRGTSTYDGVAIAHATLAHLAHVGCNTLFVTHYPMVAEQLAREFPEKISNWHMSFDEVRLPDGSAEITFLYCLSPGLAEASFGVWCARLAGLPQSVLTKAQAEADHLKAETRRRRRTIVARRAQRLFGDLKGKGGERADEVWRNVEALRQNLVSEA
ncbi:Mismatch repair protein msh3 [Cryptotrichosporon argae]